MASDELWPASILVRSTPSVSIGRSRENDVVLRHPSISAQHCVFEKVGEGLVVSDSGAKIGTFVNGVRAMRVQLKAGDAVRFASGPDYAFDGDALTLAAGGVGELHLDDVGVRRDGRLLLSGIDCRIRGGTFVGVLGPSGAGKSLLVGCLSSTIAPDIGCVRFGDGRTVAGNEKEFRAQLGIVTQEDLVQTTLTVEESLELAGRLRLPEMSAAERGERIDVVLQEVDLAPHRAKQVSVLSGGQRKRVSIAIELLMRPRLLLLDEPTSGLDPAVAARLMDVLRGLARRGLTIVCTTHTLDTLNYFDSVLVLGLIQQASSGDRTGTLAYFDEPAGLLARFRVRSIIDLFERLQDVSSAADSQATTPHGPKDDSGSDEETRTTWRTRLGPAPKPRVKPSFATQVHVVLRRALLGFLRDPGSATLNLVQPFVLALLTLLAQHSATSSMPVQFFLVIAALWMGMTLTVREIVREQKLYVRDRLIALGPNAYIAGKTLFAAIVLAGIIAVLYGTARGFGQLILDRDGQAARQIAEVPILGGWFVLWITAIGGGLIGLVISTLAGTERVAVMLLPIALLLQVLLSRVVYGHATLPWSDTSPYGPMQDFSRYLDSSGAPWQGVLVALLSSAMVSRPATAVLDYWTIDDAGAGRGKNEWTYLAILTVVYLAAAWVIFRRRESRWIRELR